MKQNKTKAKIRAGGVALGCFVRYANAALVEFLGYQGWDFLVFDAEHGTIEPQDCEQMVRAAELRDVTPIARAPTNAAHVILRYLDTGLQGVHIPLVNTRADMEAAVASVKYHPSGVRGLAGTRAASYGQAMPLKEYTKRANEETLIVAHIETAEAVERLDTILGVKGLDVVFIGPTDLSHSFGVPGDTQHPRVKEAVERIVTMTLESAIALGIFVGNAGAGAEWCRRGARYVAVGLESVLGPAARTYLSDVRKATAHDPTVQAS
jgi:4-hydroxy-2-oxoheptanedioate aldolase